eukprot:13078044-Alexandrium_andersonii.AAC.1
MSASLVGSEMCIRDRLCVKTDARAGEIAEPANSFRTSRRQVTDSMVWPCLLYTSDAADDM